MDWDDTRPAPKTYLGEPIATMSIGELEARIIALRQELDRVSAEIAKKKAHEAAASALFKS